MLQRHTCSQYYTWESVFVPLLCLMIETPAQVHSVEVIKTVGQNSLMIAWERPPLDELGCSNGTFVYGYRVGGAQEVRVY